MRILEPSRFLVLDELLKRVKLKLLFLDEELKWEDLQFLVLDE